jgi:hypothetical protein
VLDQDGTAVTGLVATDGVDWDWGDGVRGNVGVQSNHQFTQAGTFTVSAGVNLNGLRAIATKVLTIT